ncbi:translation elongation factor Ts [Spirochaetota bacterium]
MQKALIEAEGDFAIAERKLKEWGLAGVAKRSGRATNEGRIFLHEDKGNISLVEIACETDFVCKNEDFIKGGNKIARLSMEKNYDQSVEELENIVKDMASVIKENITLKQVVLEKANNNEILHSYVHGEGKLAVIVKFSSDKPEVFKIAEVADFIHDIALHVAAFRPMYLKQNDIDPAWLEEQKSIFAKQIESDEKMAGKPAKVIEGILAGKVKKLMTEVCLLDQAFVKDEKQSVSTMLSLLSGKVNAKLEIKDMIYAKVGEN